MPGSIKCRSIKCRLTKNNHPLYSRRKKMLRNIRDLFLPASSTGWNLFFSFVPTSTNRGKYFPINDLKKRGLYARDKLTLAAVGDCQTTTRHSPCKDPRFLELVEILRNADVAYANEEMVIHNFGPDCYPRGLRRRNDTEQSPMRPHSLRTS